MFRTRLASHSENVLIALSTCGRTASNREIRSPNFVGSGFLSDPPTVGNGAWIAAPMTTLVISVPSRFTSKESCKSVWPRSRGSSEISKDRIQTQNIRQHEKVQVQRVVPDHEPVICQLAKCFGLLRNRDPLCAFDRHQRGKEMRNRTRATDPGQKRRNRNDPLAPNRRCKKPPIVLNDKLQLLDGIVLDSDLEAGIALNLCDGVYSYISTRHAERCRIVAGTSSASGKRTAPSLGIRVPCRQPVSPR